MSRRFWEILAALLLILFGLLFLLDHTGAIDFRFWHFLGDIWPVVLIILGLWMIYEQARKKPCWKTSIAGSHSTKAFGSMDISPTSLDPGGAEYKIGFGDMMLNLSQTRLQPSENPVRVSLGFGDLKVHLPKDTPCSIICSCGLGNVRLMDKRSSGISADQAYEDPGFATAVQKLKIYANCGVGDVQVTREQ